MTEAYLVPNLAPDEIHREEDVVRRSRFIVSMARVSSTEEAKAFIERIRAEHPTATHNCWAFNAGAPEDTAQVGASDDGEPQGTAGRPMLTVLLHSGVGEIAAGRQPVICGGRLFQEQVVWFELTKVQLNKG